MSIQSSFFIVLSKNPSKMFTRHNEVGTILESFALNLLVHLPLTNN